MIKVTVEVLNRFGLKCQILTKQIKPLNWNVQEGKLDLTVPGLIVLSAWWK